MLDIRDKILPHFSKNESGKRGAMEKKEDEKNGRLKDNKRWNLSKPKKNSGSLDIHRQ